MTSMSLTPSQLRQIRETIETLSTIAEGNSTVTGTVSHGTALPEPARLERRQISPVTASVTEINNTPQRIATYTNAPNFLPLVTGGPPAQPAQDAGTASNSVRQRLASATGSRLQPATANHRDVSVTSASSRSSDNVGEILSAAGRCLTSIGLRSNQHSSNGGRPGKRKAKQELTSLFRKKSRAKCAWKHKFVCLAMHSQRRLPTTDREKDELIMAGLGEKEIEVFDLNMDAGEFRELLYWHYPSLKSGGGYKFYKCTANTRTLECLSPATLSSPEVLKARVGNARTYIVPLQKDLDLTPVVELPGGPTEKCLNCEKWFSLDDLSIHLDTCGTNIKDIDEYCPDLLVDHPGVVDLTDEPTSDSNNDDVDIEGGQNEDGDAHDDDSSNDEVEREMVRMAVNNSLASSSVNSEEVSGSTRERSSQRDTDNILSREINFLKENINEDCSLQIEVRRDFLLQDTLREAQKNRFHPSKFIKITFVGEGAVDYGGPKREFFRLFAQEAGKNYFIGQSSQPKFFRGDILAVQKNEFYILGVFVVLSILYGNSGMPFLSETVYDYMSTSSYSAVMPESDIPDMELQNIVCQLNKAESDRELQEIVSSDDVADKIFATGFKKPATLLTIADRGDLLRVLLDYNLMAKVKSEMDQFIKGLGTFNFISKLQQNPKLWKPYFVYMDKKLTAESLKEVFTLVKFSERGTVHRPLEEQTYIFFKEFLDKCEDNEEVAGCSLEDVLIFFSGAERVPPCGFGDVTPSLVFLRDNQVLPTASTCDLQLRLPIRYSDFTRFKDAMVLALKCHDGFGEA